VHDDAVLDVSAIGRTALTVEAGAPTITVDRGTLTIAQDMPAVGLRVAPAAHLTLQTTESFGDESFQVLCIQADVLVQTEATLTVKGGINYSVGHRSLDIDGTLNVGPGIGKLDLRSLSLSSNEDVTLRLRDSSTLEIELDDDRHDRIAIERGVAELGGNLALARVGEFVPQLGDEFDILAAQNGVTGVFDRITGSIIELGLDTLRDDLGLAVRYVDEEDAALVRVRASLLGDVDFDDSVDVEDHFQVITHFGAANATWEMGDFTGDGIVGEEDLDIVSNNLGLIRNPNAPLGDYDQNGRVDAADYAAWRGSLGDIGFALAADGNQNQLIDIGDYEIWRAHFGQSVGQVTTLANVPEPSVPMLLAIGFAASLMCRGLAMRPPAEL
jgi:hypothetical protein